MINILFYQILASAIYRKKKLKISIPTCNEKSELPDGSYSLSDIQNYFEYIIKNKISIYNPAIRTYVNKIENRLSRPFNAWNDEITWKH